MKIVGAVGRIGSGKDALVKYLGWRCKIPLFSLGDLVREEAAESGIPHNRESLQNFVAKTLSERGEDYFIRTLVEEIRRLNTNAAAISGIRQPMDVQVLRETFGASFILVHIATDDRIRLERLKERGDPRDPKAEEEFREQDLREEELFKVEETIARSDLAIENNGTLEDFYRQIDERVIPRIFE